MKRYFLWLVLGALVAVLAGCGGGDDNGRPLFQTVINSDPAVDGDILEDSTTLARTVTIPGGVPGAMLLAGVAADGDEYRAFLDFPLGGPDGVPLSAIIHSANLNIVIRNTSPIGASIPLLIELVPLGASLTPDDYDVAPFSPLSRTTTVRTIVPGQINNANGVDIDVTTLMQEAQARQLSSFQIRLLHDFVNPALGIVTIDDSDAFAPELTVVYF